MRKDTKILFKALQAAMAQAYGADVVTEQFAVDIPKAIQLMTTIQESDGFLQRITFLPVKDIKGDIIRMDIPTSIASRTKIVGGAKRNPVILGDLSGRGYECSQTNYDTALEYAKLDAWARFPNFAQLYMAAVYIRCALDKLMIGWNGTSIAETSDRVAHPLLEDVNTGWLYDLYTNNPGNFMKEVVPASGKIKIGATGDYKNLDQLVYDVYSMIEKKNRTGNEIAIIGSGLVAHDMGKMLASYAGQPTEKNAIKILSKSYGSLESVEVPFFPDYGLFVGNPANLQYYWQEDSIRRESKNEPESNRVADYQSVNDCFRIGDLNAVAGIDGAAVEFV